jgi:hypothetical protein
MIGLDTTETCRGWRNIIKNELCIKTGFFYTTKYAFNCGKKLSCSVSAESSLFEIQKSKMLKTAIGFRYKFRVKSFEWGNFNVLKCAALLNIWAILCATITLQRCAFLYVESNSCEQNSYKILLENVISTSFKAVSELSRNKSSPGGRKVYSTWNFTRAAKAVPSAAIVSARHEENITAEGRWGESCSKINRFQEAYWVAHPHD